ncbi:MAG: DsbA family protein [Pseudomonadota bacterium]
MRYAFLALGSLVVLAAAATPFLLMPRDAAEPFALASAADPGQTAQAPDGASEPASESPQHGMNEAHAAMPAPSEGETDPVLATLGLTQPDPETDPIRHYLYQNPEAVYEALQIFRLRQENQEDETRIQLFSQMLPNLLTSDGVYVLGPEDADVTVVEFFDYRCPFCRQGFEAVMQLIKSDPSVRVAFVEYPVLGPLSEVAARASIAAMKQGQYMPFHRALMEIDGDLTAERIDAIAEGLGMDLEAMHAVMTQTETSGALSLNLQIGEALNIRGTPSFFIGREYVGGFIDFAEMQAVVERARGPRPG